MKRKKKFFFFLIKRVFDILVSFELILLAFVPSLLISLIIVLDSRGPVFFKQERIGKNKKVFKMLKFRSMKVNSESKGVYEQKNDSRITKFGKFLRKTSLDELPQILNIFIGQMSFIGPRPPLTYHPWTIDKYDSEQIRMFNVRPGITGWAQVNGRKNVEWNARIKLNVWYVDNCDLFLDLKIFFKTIGAVFSNKDNYNNDTTVKNNGDSNA